MQIYKSEKINFLTSLIKAPQSISPLKCTSKILLILLLLCTSYHLSYAENNNFNDNFEFEDQQIKLMQSVKDALDTTLNYHNKTYKTIKKQNINAVKNNNNLKNTIEIANNFENENDKNIQKSNIATSKRIIKADLYNKQKSISKVNLDNKYFEHESHKCLHFANIYEKKYNLPNKVLSAIILNETGRKYVNDKNFLKSNKAWPWAVMNNFTKQSYYFTNKSEAIGFIKQQIKFGNLNLDVGCSQINLKSHKAAFNSIEQALDPEINVHYAAYLLAGHYHNNGKNWYKSIAYYHSKTKSIGTKYVHKVLKILSKLSD